ncbi:variant-silencing SET domain-containing protein-like isoform X2 [Xenia sp. Carnegie-2017]|nr:variant-silencing SET domain-containing protein-like isoform X2 [Xenia sp. Carnegie-2017]
MVLVGLIFAILETTSFKDSQGLYSSALVLEVFLLFVFTFEYILRMWSAGCRSTYSGLFGHIRFALKPFVIVDLIVIGTTFGVIVYSIFQMHSFSVSVLRFCQVLRMIRFDRQGDSWKLLGSVLFLHRQELLTTVYIGLCSLIFASFFVYQAEKDYNSEEFGTFADSFWWGIVTLTTVGYGDKVPKTWGGRAVAAFFAIMGISFFALPAGILGSGFALKVSQLQRQKYVKKRRRPAAMLIQCNWRYYASRKNTKLYATWLPYIKYLQEKNTNREECVSEKPSQTSATRVRKISIFGRKASCISSDGLYKPSVNNIYEQRKMNKNELFRSYDSLHDGVNSSTSDQHTDSNENGNAGYMADRVALVTDAEGNLRLSAACKQSIRFTRYLKFLVALRKFRLAKKPYDVKDVIEQYSTGHVEVLGKVKSIGNKIDEALRFKVETEKVDDSSTGKSNVIHRLSKLEKQVRTLDIKMDKMLTLLEHKNQTSTFLEENPSYCLCRHTYKNCPNSEACPSEVSHLTMGECITMFCEPSRWRKINLLNEDIQEKSSHKMWKLESVERFEECPRVGFNTANNLLSPSYENEDNKGCLSPQSSFHDMYDNCPSPNPCSSEESYSEVENEQNGMAKPGCVTLSTNDISVQKDISDEDNFSRETILADSFHNEQVYRQPNLNTRGYNKNNKGYFEIKEDNSCVVDINNTGRRQPQDSDQLFNCTISNLRNFATDKKVNDHCNVITPSSSSNFYGNVNLCGYDEKVPFTDCQSLEGNSYFPIHETPHLKVDKIVKSRDDNIKNNASSSTSRSFSNHGDNDLKVDKILESRDDNVKNNASFSPSKSSSNYGDNDLKVDKILKSRDDNVKNNASSSTSKISSNHADKDLKVVKIVESRDDNVKINASSSNSKISSNHGDNDLKVVKIVKSCNDSVKNDASSSTSRSSLDHGNNDLKVVKIVKRRDDSVKNDASSSTSRSSANHEDNDLKVVKIVKSRDDSAKNDASSSTSKISSNHGDNDLKVDKILKSRDDNVKNNASSSTSKSSSNHGDNDLKMVKIVKSRDDNVKNNASSSTSRGSSNHEVNDLKVLKIVKSRDDNVKNNSSSSPSKGSSNHADNDSKVVKIVKSRDGSAKNDASSSTSRSSSNRGNNDLKVDKILKSRDDNVKNNASSSPNRSSSNHEDNDLKVDEILKSRDDNAKNNASSSTSRSSSNHEDNDLKVDEILKSRDDNAKNNASSSPNRSSSNHEDNDLKVDEILKSRDDNAKNNASSSPNRSSSNHGDNDLKVDKILKSRDDNAKNNASSSTSRSSSNHGNNDLKLDKIVKSRDDNAKNNASSSPSRSSLDHGDNDLKVDKILKSRDDSVKNNASSSPSRSSSNHGNNDLKVVKIVKSRDDNAKNNASSSTSRSSSNHGNNDLKLDKIVKSRDDNAKNNASSSPSRSSLDHGDNDLKVDKILKSRDDSVKNNASSSTSRSSSNHGNNDLKVVKIVKSRDDNAKNNASSSPSRSSLDHGNNDLKVVKIVKSRDDNAKNNASSSPSRSSLDHGDNDLKVVKIVKSHDDNAKNNASSSPSRSSSNHGDNDLKVDKLLKSRDDNVKNNASSSTSKSSSNHGYNLPEIKVDFVNTTRQGCVDDEMSLKEKSCRRVTDDFSTSPYKKRLSFKDSPSIRLIIADELHPQILEEKFKASTVLDDCVVKNPPSTTLKVDNDYCSQDNSRENCIIEEDLLPLCRDFDDPRSRTDSAFFSIGSDTRNPEELDDMLNDTDVNNTDSMKCDKIRETQV